MEEWKEYKFGKVAVFSQGIQVGIEKQIETCKEGYVRFIRIVDYTKGTDAPRYILYPGARYMVDETDIVMMRYGTPGKVARGYSGAIANNMFKITVNEDFLNKDYTFYYLSQDSVYRTLVASNSSSTMPAINFKIIEGLDISAPSISEQMRIVKVLKSLDDKIEVNRKINENLEQQAQALFKSWFVDFEPFKDQPFVESELGMIPQGWKVGCLDDLCSFISRGLTPKYDETSDELILGQTCVRNNIVTLNNARKHRPKSKTEKWVQQWDILLNSTGIGSLGRVGVVYFNMDNVAIDSHITVVRTSKSLYRHYVGRNLLSRQLEIENMAVGSTGQTELPRDRVKTMTIIVPSDDALTKFNYIIEPMALTMYRNIVENKRLAELRDTLLPRLMSGELKVDEVNV